MLLAHEFSTTIQIRPKYKTVRLRQQGVYHVHSVKMSQSEIGHIYKADKIRITTFVSAFLLEKPTHVYY